MPDFIFKGADKEQEAGLEPAPGSNCPPESTQNPPLFPSEPSWQLIPHMPEASGSADNGTKTWLLHSSPSPAPGWQQSPRTPCCPLTTLAPACHPSPVPILRARPVPGWVLADAHTQNPGTAALCGSHHATLPAAAVQAKHAGRPSPVVPARGGSPVVAPQTSPPRALDSSSVKTN